MDSGSDRLCRNVVRSFSIVSDDHHKRSWIVFAERMVGVVAIGALLVAGFHLGDQALSRWRRTQSSTLDANRFAELLAPDQTFELGKKSTVGSVEPVRIVIFTDLHCPFCARLHRELQLLDARLERGGATVHIRHTPFSRIHPDARLASAAVVCAAQQGRLREYVDVAFSESHFASSDWQSLAQLSGLASTSKFQECLRDPVTDRRVGTDVALGRTLGVEATPTTYIEGRMMRGAISADSFAIEIEAARARARRNR